MYCNVVSYIQEELKLQELEQMLNVEHLGDHMRLSSTSQRSQGI